MKATTKAYAMSSGTVTSFVLFSTYFALVGLKSMSVMEPYSIAFILLGICLPYLISSLTIGSAAKTAVLMVDEVRRQFRTIPGILKGETLPDYATCIDISTRNALKEMVLPGVISIAVPIVVASSLVIGPLELFLLEPCWALHCWGHSSTTRAQLSTTRRSSLKTAAARDRSNTRQQ